MREDIRKFALLLGICWLLGLSLGYAKEALLAGALAVIAWQMYRLELLYRWIRSPSKNPLAETSGQVHLLHRELSSRLKTNRLRKQQLSEHLEQFRRAIRVLPDAIILIDYQGKIQWANQNAGLLMGLHWPADKGVRFADLIRHPEIAKQLKSLAISHSKSDDSSKHNIDGLEIRSHSNRDMTLNIKMIPYTQDLVMVLARDVSRLLKLNRMHSDFVANVSHELKTPLTVLKGYLEILQNMIDRDNAKATELNIIKPVAQMSSQTERMQFIVSDLLYLSKLEDRENLSVNQWVPVAQLITGIIEAVQPQINAKQHQIEVAIDPDSALYGSRNELQSAFTNLLVNAINYTPINGVIKLKWQVLQATGTDESRLANFSVTDSGPGIEASHIPRLTERFYRIDDDRSRDNGGTGLGLAIVKHVLQRHDASLEIVSTAGIGSSFRCVFPASRVSQNIPTIVDRDAN